jgi:hypothetical protein
MTRVVVFSKSCIRDQPQVKEELEDVFDGNERPAAVVIQRPYIVKCNALRIQADGAEEIPM